MLTFNKNIEDACEAFLAEFAELYPVDYAALRYIDQDEEGLDDYVTRRKSRHWRKMAFYAAIGGFIPEMVSKERVYYWDCEKQYAWAGEVGDAINEEDIADGLRGVNILVPEGALSTLEKQLLRNAGCLTWSLSDLITVKLSEIVDTFAYENTVNYLHNLGAKYIEEEEGWSFTIGRYAEVFVKYQDDHWYIDDGSMESEVKEYVCLNNTSMHNKHLNVVIGLFYILSGMRESDVKGRKAFSPFMFVDEIHVGFTHDILDTANRHKVGMVDFGLKGRNFLPELGKGSDLVAAAAMYEARGWSVFMHKGGKYIIVHAECIGFARINNATYVAWYADKEAKLTGRNLFTVATAAEWIDD